MPEQMWDTATAPVAAAAPTARVLVVDDEPSMRQMLSFALRREGYDVATADDGRSALEALRDGRFDLVVTDVRMPDVSGVDLLREAKRLDPSLSIIMMTAYGSKETVLEALRLGATDYVEKTPNLRDELTLRVRKELDRKRLQQENVLMKRTLKSAHQFSNIIGSSEPMLAIFQLVETIAPTGSTVLIAGESGTGKELVARAIHFNSPRKDRPFVALNCGALSETLLDSELFGHVRGAFTSADTNKKGLIEIAEKGTIFLDEIGEMSPLVQVKLLRVLQERKFRRLGGTDEVDADIRIIAATNRDLSKMVAEGKFREDLFYRINVIPDPAAAAARAQGGHSAAGRALRRPLCEVDGQARHRHLRRRARTAEGIRLAGKYPRARECDGAGGGARADALDPGRQPARSGPDAAPTWPQPSRPPCRAAFPTEGFHLEQHVQHLEREYIAEALRRAGGVKVKAAELLGMSFRSFRYYTKKYNLK